MLAGAIQQWAPILGFAFVLVGVTACAATYGLWVLALWGHSLTRILYIISIPLGVIVLASNRTPGNVILQLAGIGLAVWILDYLSKPKIEGLFRAP